MRFLQLHNFLIPYMNVFYESHPGMENRPYHQQLSMMIQDGFAGCHLRTPYLPALGYECELILGNCAQAQRRWAVEHGLPVPQTPLDFAQLIVQQIDHFKPDILYITDPVSYDSLYVRALAKRPPLVLGWRAALIPPHVDWSAFDLVVSSDEACLRVALERGAPASQFFWPHFPTFLAEAVAGQPKVFDLVFTGQVSPAHGDRLKLLCEVAKAPLGWRGEFTPAFFLASGKPQELPAGLLMYDKGSVWGMLMHQILKAGKIVLNAHIDLAEKKSLNMRTFEATGTGSFLLTESSSVLQDFFVAGKELVTYDGAEDLLDKLYYYLEHEDEREAIARRGQQRCLTDYSAEKGAQELDAIIHQTLAKAGRTVARSPKAALKVDVVNAWESQGGAAQAANRLFKALRATGVDASMLVYERSSDDPHVRLIDETKADPLMRESIRRTIADEITAHGGNYYSAGVFGLDHSERGVALLSCLDSKADIINLHWVGNLIDWELFFQPGAVNAPVVWTLHDMRPFTGGCHYSGECENYQTGCGYCKFFGATTPNDLSRVAFARQHAAVSGWPGRLHVVTPSHWLAREAAKSPIMAGVPISVIPNSIDIDLFQAPDKATARAGNPGLDALYQTLCRASRKPGKKPAKSKHHKGHHANPSDEAAPALAQARILLFVAHNLSDPRKGSTHLVDALNAVAGLPDLLLVTVGANPPAFPAAIPHICVGEVTDQAQLNGLYAAADLVVLPTLQDNLPNIILEAFASGTPVAGFAVGGVPDHIRDGETGFLVPPGDSHKLGVVLRTALTDLPRLAQMGKAARAHAEREFAPAVQAERYRALFDQLLTSGLPKARRTTPIPALAPVSSEPAVTLRGSFGEVINHLAQNLAAYPRRVPGKLQVDGNILSYADLHSFFFQGLQIFRDKFYDFQSSVPNPLIIDCGAHIGMASMYYAAHIPGATIHAYEADPEIAAHLFKNVATLKLRNVFPHAKAVWIHDQGVQFVNSHDDSGFVGDSGDTVVTLPSVRLRDLLRDQPVEMLKIDVEGAEYDLLTDCDGMLGSVNKMVIETHQLQDGKCRLGEMLAVLERNGFRYVPFDLQAAVWAHCAVKPPFTACPTDKYIISFFAWRDP